MTNTFDERGKHERLSQDEGYMALFSCSLPKRLELSSRAQLLPLPTAPFLGLLTKQATYSA